MAFQSYDELISTAQKDPNRARSLVKRAQNQGIPVVSKTNPGYGDTEDSRMAAMRRRMTTKTAMKMDQEETQKLIKERKGLNY